MMSKTNADLIRSMSNEELAQYLYDVSLHPSSSVSNLLEWLNQPFKRKGPKLTIAEVYKIRLATWIFKNRQLFTNTKVGNCCLGKEDESFVYIVNRAFQSFCEFHGYDSHDVLKTLSESDFILTRWGTFHGGHYRSTRICCDVESCVWLIKDELFCELEDSYCENP